MPSTRDARRGPVGPAGEVARLFAPILGLYAVYTVIRFLLADRGPLVGLANAESIIALEQRLRIDWEFRLQSFAVAREWLVTAANWYYVAGFLPVLVAGTALSIWRAPAAFHWWRTVFILSLLIALIGYATFPLTPPRLMPDEWGYIDTLQIYGPRYYGNIDGHSLFNAYGSLPSLVNVYAAMPSMHVAWSVVAGALIAAAGGNRRWLIVLAVAHPVAMAFAVVATANHFVLDIVAGLAVLALAIGLAAAAGRWRAAPVFAEPVRRGLGASD